MIQLSIIIPTFNRAEQLRACLDALSHQTQPATEFEVIVVVNGSTDGTREMLATLVPPYRLRVCWLSKGSLGAACNHGVGTATGRYCLFLDDDVIAAPGLVAAHLKIQREQEGVVGIGQIILQLPSRADAFARFLAQERQDRHTQLGQGSQLPSCMDCDSANLSIPREAFLKAGGVAVDLPSSEGVELGYRLENQGLSFVYIPDAMGHQSCHKGFGEVAADAERDGETSIELYRHHPSILPHLQLGAFHNMGLYAVLLRRVLLTIRCPLRPLMIIGPLLGKQSWRSVWYRFLHSYGYWRGVQRAVSDRDTWHRLTRGPVILVYHAFTGRREVPRRFVVSAAHFARQLAWLKKRRYYVLSLEEFLRYRHEHRLPPARSVVITFDDGYADNRTVAHPLLRKYGFPATIFLVSGAVGATNQWDCEGELAGRPLLSWSDIKDMLREDIHFGAHTRNHLSLTGIPASRTRDEIEGSRADLEQELGLPVLVFAYPYGKNDLTSQAVVEHAGFLGACSFSSGRNDPATPLYALRRTEIRGTDSLLRFVVALWLGQARFLSPWWSRR